MNLAWNEIAQSEYLQHPRHGGRIGLGQDGKTRNRNGSVRLVGGRFPSISIIIRHEAQLTWPNLHIQLPPSGL
jgi:hypothetical protein